MHAIVQSMFGFHPKRERKENNDVNCNSITDIFAKS